MSKLDYLKDKSLNKREVFRIVGLTLIAALTGTVASAYSSFIGVAPSKAFWATALGLTATTFLAFLLRKLWIELEQIEEELKEMYEFLNIAFSVAAISVVLYVLFDMSREHHKVAK